MSRGIRTVSTPAAAGAMDAWSASSIRLPSGRKTTASQTRRFSTCSGASTAESRREPITSGSLAMRWRTSARNASQPSEVKRSAVSSTRSSRAEYQITCEVDTESVPRRSVASRRAAAMSSATTASCGWISRRGSALGSVSRRYWSIWARTAPAMASVQAGAPGTCSHAPWWSGSSPSSTATLASGTRSRSCEGTSTVNGAMSMDGRAEAAVVAGAGSACGSVRAQALNATRATAARPRAARTRRGEDRTGRMRFTSGGRRTPGWPRRGRPSHPRSAGASPGRSAGGRRGAGAGPPRSRGRPGSGPGRRWRRRPRTRR